jgi:hypothetical protein
MTDRERTAMPVPQSRECPWRKSTFSGGSGQDDCVEIAFAPDIASVRDSKSAGGEVLDFTTGAWRSFLVCFGRAGSVE